VSHTHQSNAVADPRCSYAFVKTTALVTLTSLFAILVAGCSTTSPLPQPVDIFHEQATLQRPLPLPIVECSSEQDAMTQARKLAAQLHGEVGFNNGATGSMTPLFEHRLYIEVLVTLPMSRWQPGQVVSAESAYGIGVAHVLQRDPQGLFYTQGLHNKRPDPGFVDERNYNGTVVGAFGWGHAPITALPVIVYKRQGAHGYCKSIGTLDGSGFVPHLSVPSDELPDADQLTSTDLAVVADRFLVPTVAWTGLTRAEKAGDTNVTAHFVASRDSYSLGGMRYSVLAPRSAAAPTIAASARSLAANDSASLLASRQDAQ